MDTTRSDANELFTNESDEISLSTNRSDATRSCDEGTNDNLTLSFVSHAMDQDATRSDTIALSTNESDAIRSGTMGLSTMGVGRGGGQNHNAPEIEPAAKKKLYTSHAESQPLTDEIIKRGLSSGVKGRRPNIEPDENIADQKDELPKKKYGFQPGNAFAFKQGNPGRKPGSRGKLGEDFIYALQDDFKKHGPATVIKVRENSPVAYLKIIANLLPKDINLNLSANQELSDGELLAQIRNINDAIGPLLSASRAIDITPGSPEETEDQETDVLPPLPEAT